MLVVSAFADVLVSHLARSDPNNDPLFLWGWLLLCLWARLLQLKLARFVTTPGAAKGDIAVQWLPFGKFRA